MNAIILAAGLGSRFGDWTENNHKSLFPILGIPNIERTIQLLIEENISPIYILTGHMAEKFAYLEEKYPDVQLIYNPYYKIYNNIYTFSLILPRFSNTWVIDGDTVILKNIFNKEQELSTYFTILRNNDSIEWCPLVQDGKIKEILITNEKLPSLSGISYWCEKECVAIQNLYAKYMNESMLLNAKLYWDDIVRENLSELNIKVDEIANNVLYEMDTKEDYEKILSYLTNEHSK